jgi:GntP family gluconate:H+ symporter
MITTSGIIAAIIGVDGGAEMVNLPYHPVYLFAAIAFGSNVGSWMNDSGFWVVCKLSGFTEGETLKTWTIMLASLGVFGLIEVLILSTIIPLK